MNPWNCCRTCLGVNSLKPLLSVMDLIAEGNVKCSEALLSTALKIQINDGLPQEICIQCIDLVKKFLRFQKKSNHSHKILLERQKNGQYCHVKMEPDKLLKSGTKKSNPTIDISEIIDKSFHEIKQANIESNKEHGLLGDDDNKSEMIEFEATVEEILKNYKSFQIVNLPSNFLDNVKIETEERNSMSELDFNMELELDELHSKDENVSKKPPEGAEPFECRSCKKVYKSKFSYISHQKIHDGIKIVCEHCGKSFLDKRRLLMHCKAKHGYLKTDKCSFCDYTGASKEAVKIHERLHTGEKPYVCDVCSASFHRKSSYLQHKPIHLTVKTVQCDLCPALFKSTTLMRIHKAKHKPREYKHKCLVCGATFGKRWHCLRHLQRIHGVTNLLDDHLERIRLNDIEK